MNKKLKKILAGIGITVAGATIMTACSADVSQEKIDETLEKVNYYLEYNTENNSEYVKQELYKLLIKNATKDMDNYNYGVKQSVVQRNGASVIEHENYFVTNLRKDSTGKFTIYVSGKGVGNQGYYVVTPKTKQDGAKEAEYDVDRYYTKATEQNKKVHSKKENVKESELGATTGYDITSLGEQWMTQLSTLMEELQNNSSLTITMERKSSSELVFSFISMDTVGSTKLSTISEITFKDDVLTKIVGTTQQQKLQETYYDYAGTNTFTIEFSYGTNPIDIDTSAYEDTAWE